MGKLLDITSRINTNVESKKKSSKDTHEVLDMTEKREAIINKEKRQVKRTILTEFVGAYVVLPERGLHKVTLYDISENGIAFDLNLDEGSYQEDDEVAMRVYLNHKTYFPFVVTVTNIREFADEGIIRHGANFVKGTINDVALNHFVKFIENVSASLKTDHGDVLVSNIS